MKENEKIINDLIKHLELGKPILNRRRKPINAKTIYKYGVWMPKLDAWLNKPFTQLTEQDVDKFRKALKDDKIKNDHGKPYKESVKRDIEQKFLKTLLNYLNKPELAYFISTYSDEIEVSALSREEIERIVSRSQLREKLIFQILFDGGFRIEEFLNIQFKDIKDDALKSDGYYKIRITKSKTLTRTVGLMLPDTTSLIKEWLNSNPDKVGTSQPFVNITYRHLCLNLKRIGDKVLKKHIHPHLLRHSSATYYCHKLNQYQLCKRYGWATNSGMPQRYIDREGIDDEAINTKIVKEENINFHKEINSLKEQLNTKQDAVNELQQQLLKQDDRMKRLEEAIELRELYKKSKR